MEMINNINNFKRRKKLYKRGRLFAWIDTVACMLFLLVNEVFCLNVLYTQLNRHRHRSLPGKTNAWMVYIFTIWVTVLMVCLYTSRDSLFTNEKEKKVFDKVSSYFLMASVAIAGISLLLYPFINGFILKVTEPNLKGNILLVSYLRVVLLCIFFLFRRLFSFDFYESFYFKQKGYNVKRKEIIIFAYILVLQFIYL